MKRLSLAVSLLWCAACEPIEGDAFDASVMVDASEAVADAGPSDGGDLIDKQNGGTGPTNWPTASDYAQFPLSVMVGPRVPAGWQSSTGVWLYVLWGRQGVVGGGGKVGTWFRGFSGSVNGQASLFAKPFTSGHWTCHVGWMGAECVHVDGRRANLTCPTMLTMEMREWRSSYNAYAPQVGYFPWHIPTAAKWASFPERIPSSLQGVVITADGKQVNCLFSLPTDIDLWLELRY